MNQITSTDNQLIKKVTSLHEKKYREETGLFIIEGYKSVCEAMKSKLKIQYIFVIEDLDKDLNFFPDEQLYTVPEKVMKKISTTTSPTEILAIAHQPKFTLKDVFKDKNPLIVILENIKDPGNLGTIIRTAKACNVSGILMGGGGCVDIFNTKTVRASSGSIWKLPIVKIADEKLIKNTINNEIKCTFFATSVNNNKTETFFKSDFKKPTVIMFGSEADGLSDVLLSQADKIITIPMNNEVESLNLSISTGVILYEAVRQRES
jgi:RNA methyltransferase, TrmH family